MKLPKPPCAVYRLRDENGVLLYVGISNNPERRLEAHAADKHWWSECASYAIDWHETRDHALAAETAAILAEAPRYNVAGSPPDRQIGQLRREIADLRDQVQNHREVIESLLAWADEIERRPPDHRDDAEAAYYAGWRDALHRKETYE